MDDRVRRAVEFIKLVQGSSQETLSELIKREAGDDLSRFFINYCVGLVSKDPARVIENTSALMLMGYLFGREELRTTNHQNVFSGSLAQA